MPHAAPPPTAAPSPGTSEGVSPAPRLVECALCGYAFDPDGRGCQSGCPLASACNVACCPSCGYSFPQERKGIAGRLRTWLDRRRERAA